MRQAEKPRGKHLVVDMPQPIQFKGLAPPVSHEFDPSEHHLHEVSERLMAGLATCRSMVENYSSLIRTGPLMTAAQSDVAQDADAATMGDPD